MQETIRAKDDRFRLAVIGDLHTHWDDVDVAQFRQSDYDLLFFTGDLGGGTPDSSLRMARAMSGLGRPALVMPGNNDTGDIALLAAELAARTGIQALLAAARNDLDGHHPTRLCGYSQHSIHVAGRDIGLIAGRPHSMGGPHLSFAEYMAETYGINSLSASARRLHGLVDECPAGELIFLAHNGPTGLGDSASDIWGCDFRDGAGDWGDPDLADAIAYAQSRGKTVLAVIAGHMHLRTRQGVTRPWQLERDGVLYLNAARVPRIFTTDEDVVRHHVAVTIDAHRISAEEVLVRQHG
jgi:uncharacterized protein (TIGR04168 family)